MALRLVKGTILDDGELDSDGYRVITKKFVFRGNIGETLTTADVLTNAQFPQRHSALSENPVFKMDTATVSRDGEIPPTFTATARYTTRESSSTDRDGNAINSDTPPWKLPVTDLTVSFPEIKEPFDYALDDDGEAKTPVVNSAGDRILMETTRHLVQYQFSYNVRLKRANATFLQDVVNKDAEKILGIAIAPKTALLKPVEWRKLVTMDNSGKIKWEYWQLNVSFMVNTRGWWRRALNVGTRAKFKQEMSEPIYQYYPWTSKDPAAQMTVKPTFGSIADVIQARRTYADNGGNFSDLPYNEVSEPLPLTQDGKVYLDAIMNPAENRYLEWRFREYPEVSWAVLDLPKER